MVAAATTRLAQAGVASPDVDAELLLAHVLEVPRARLAMVPEPTEELSRAFEVLVARRAAHVPLQHLTGTAPFRHVELSVGPGVFVPRPETEMLVGWVLDLLASLEVPSPVVADLGTGSGAIAAALADEAPAARVHAVEQDEAAYGYAERNLAGSAVDLRHGNLADAFGDLEGGVDVVVSNPPYIPLTAWDSVAPEVRDHDPAAALWAGADGLCAIRDVERAAYRLLRPGGYVACEHADAQGESAPQVFTVAGRWGEVRDRLDLGSRPRFVTARKALSPSER